MRSRARAPVYKRRRRWILATIRCTLWSLGLAEDKPKFDDLERRLAGGPVITVPTITLEGDANGAPATRSPFLTPRNSPANMSTGPSRAASGTICLRNPHTFANSILDVAEV
jgi:hypothetical protein